MIDTTPQTPENQTTFATERKSAQTAQTIHLSRGRRTIVSVLIGLAILAVLVFGSQIIVSWNDGTIEINVADGIVDQDIQVLVERGGTTRVISQRNGWTLSLDEGTYKLNLGRGIDRFLLERDSVTVERGGTEIVSVRIKRNESLPLATTNEPSRQDTNSAGAAASSASGPHAPTPTLVEEQLIIDHPDLDGLRRRVEAVTTSDPHDEAVVALRQDLATLQTKILGQPASVQVGQLMSELPWPIDTLKREDIQEYELEHLGSGVLQPRGMGMVVGVLGDSRMMDWGGVSNVFWMPDGTTLLSITQKGRVCLWDTESGREINSYWIGDHNHHGAALSSDGKQLAVASSMGTRGAVLQLLDSRTGEELQAFTGTRQTPNEYFYYFFQAALSPDGRFIAAAAGMGWDSNGELSIWEISSGKLLTTLQEKKALSAAYSPNGTLLASVADDGVLRVWNIETGKTRFEVHDLGTKTRDVTFSPDGATLVVPCHNQEKSYGFRVYNTLDGSLHLEGNGHGTPFSTFVYSPDGKRLFAPSVLNSLWDTETGMVAVPLGGIDRYSVSHSLSGAFNPDGNVLATGHADGAIRLWDPATGEELLPPKHESHRSCVSAVAVNRDGTHIATGGRGEIRMWDVESQHLTQLLKTTGDRDCNILRFNPAHPELIVTNAGAWHFELWNFQNKKSRDVLIERVAVTAVYVDPHRRYAYAVVPTTIDSTGEILTWDSRSEQIVNRIRLENRSPHGLKAAFRADGKECATVTREGTITVYSLPTGNRLRQFRVGSPGGDFRVTYSPDGRSLAVHDGSAFVAVVDVTTGDEKMRFNGGAKHVAFSPDGQLLAVDQTTVFDVTTGQEVVRFDIGLVHGLCFTPDSRHLVTANGNGTAYILRLKER